MHKNENSKKTPKRLRPQHYWLTVGIILMTLIIAGSFSHFQPYYNPNRPVLTFLIDKGKHFAAFFITALIIINLYRKHQRKWVLFSGLIAFGGLIEILQGATGYRTCDLGDFIADTLGAAIILLPAWKTKNSGEPTPQYQPAIEEALHD